MVSKEVRVPPHVVHQVLVAGGNVFAEHGQKPPWRHEFVQPAWQERDLLVILRPTTYGATPVVCIRLRAEVHYGSRQRYECTLILITGSKPKSSHRLC